MREANRPAESKDPYSTEHPGAWDAAAEVRLRRETYFLRGKGENATSPLFGWKNLVRCGPRTH